MALLINSRLLAEDALKAFKNLSKKVHTSISKGKSIDSRSFASTMRIIGDTFEMQGQKYLMNYNGAQLAENLSKQNEHNLASILYGILIKNNNNNPVLTEEFARKALQNAKKTKDPIHIMARADDLNRLYRITEYGSEKHLKVLMEEKKALLKIVSDYKKAVRSYRTISRLPLSIDHYEFMLCGIRMELAKIMKYTYPLQAIKELEAAQKIMQKHGQGTLTQRIEMLLDEAYSSL